MIKVLVVETTRFGYDGITNVITNYYTYMNRERIQMNIVTINPVSKTFGDFLVENGNINYVIPYRNYNPIKYIVELRKILKQGGYEILHVHGCSATMAIEMFAGVLAGIKVRISHSHNTKCDHIYIDKILRTFFNRWCNVAYACSKEAGEWMFPDRKFEIITNGINLDKFQYNKNVRDQFRKKYMLNGKVIIGHVGRFSEQKNHEKLINIFKEFSRNHDNAKLVLIGDGELKECMVERTKDLGLDVLFVGLSDEVEKWLQAMDIMVFPSLFEGLPLGLIEAQAAGLPCVLSDTISPMTKITHFVKFVDLCASAEEWCTIIDGLLNKFDRKALMKSVKDQLRNAHFDIKNNCDELADRYENLLCINQIRKEFR